MTERQEAIARLQFQCLAEFMGFPPVKVASAMRAKHMFLLAVYDGHIRPALDAKDITGAERIVKAIRRRLSGEDVEIELHEAIRAAAPPAAPELTRLALIASNPSTALVRGVYGLPSEKVLQWMSLAASEAHHT